MNTLEMAASSITLEERKLIARYLPAITAAYDLADAPGFNQVEAIYIRSILAGNRSGTYTRSCKNCLRQLVSRLKLLVNSWEL